MIWMVIKEQKRKAFSFFSLNKTAATNGINLQMVKKKKRLLQTSAN